MVIASISLLFSALNRQLESALSTSFSPILFVPTLLSVPTPGDKKVYYRG